MPGNPGFSSWQDAVSGIPPSCHGGGGGFTRRVGGATASFSRPPLTRSEETVESVTNLSVGPLLAQWGGIAAPVHPTSETIMSGGEKNDDVRTPIERINKARWENEPDLGFEQAIFKAARAEGRFATPPSTRWRPSSSNRPRR